MKNHGRKLFLDEQERVLSPDAVLLEIWPTRIRLAAYFVIGFLSGLGVAYLW